MKRNTLFALITVITSLSLSLVAVNLLFDLFIEKHVRQSLLREDQLSFYSAYSNEMNHLRQLDFFKVTTNIENNVENLLYTELNPDGMFKSQILIQGDSWIEQIISREKSMEVFERTIDINDGSYVIAGISSFSPSLMTAQARILREDFNINPDKVIAYIDQTDIGDELCRYRQYRSTQGGIVKVSAFTGQEMAVYDLELPLQVQGILNSASVGVIKGLKLLAIKVKALGSTFGERKSCDWNDIAQYLKRELTPEERNYMTGVIKDYVEEVFRSPNLKELHLVWFPHYNHILGAYTTNVGDLITEAVEVSSLSKQIFITTPYSSQMFENVSLDAMYLEGDLASHLSIDSHKIFSEYLVRL